MTGIAMPLAMATAAVAAGVSSGMMLVFSAGTMQGEPPSRRHASAVTRWRAGTDGRSRWPDRVGGSALAAQRVP